MTGAWELTGFYEGASEKDRKRASDNFHVASQNGWMGDGWVDEQAVSIVTRHKVVLVHRDEHGCVEMRGEECSQCTMENERNACSMRIFCAPVLSGFVVSRACPLLLLFFLSPSQLNNFLWGYLHSKHCVILPN